MTKFHFRINFVYILSTFNLSVINFLNKWHNMTLTSFKDKNVFVCSVLICFFAFVFLNIFTFCKKLGKQPRQPRV